MSSFAKKRMRVTLIMTGANAVFPGTNSNTLVLENLRVSAKVQAVARLATQADITIYGMKQSDMDALTVAWANPPVVLDNIVILEADGGDGYKQVFKGTMIEAQPNYQGAPDVFFNLLAMTGYFQKINPVAPRSFPAQSEADVVIGGIAADMGLDFTIEGALGALAEGAYFWGTLWDQLAQACQAVNADFYIFGDKLLVTEPGRPSSQQPSVKLGPQSGLIGYPMFERSGLLVAAIYDPAFQCGVPLDIDGDVPAANGRWYPYSMIHVLEAIMPRGQWQTQMRCLKVLV